MDLAQYRRRLPSGAAPLSFLGPACRLNLSFSPTPPSTALTMPRRFISSFFSILLFLGLGSEALALQADHVIPWPNGLPSPGIFGRTVAGDLSGNGVDDVVVLAGSEPVYLFDPHVHDAVVPTSILGVQDIDIVPGTPAELALAQDGKLVLVTLDGQAMNPFVQTLVPLGGSWSSLDFIRSTDLDGDGRHDFVGLTDGDTVILIVNDPSGTYTLDSSFQITGTATELEVVSWNASDPAIAVHTSGGVSVYDQNGVLLNGYLAGTPGSTMGVVHTKRLFDRLAWQKPDTSGAEALYMLSSDPAFVQSPIYFDFTALPSPPEPVGAVVAVVGCDHDGDKQDDVVVVHQGTHEAVVFPSNELTGLIGASPSSAVAYGPAGSASNQFACPVAVDLNDDKTEDLLFPVQSTEEFAVCFGPFTPLGVQESSSPDPFEVTEPLEACCDYTADTATFYFDKIIFDDPRPAVTHLNVILWRRPTPTSNLQPVAQANLLFAVTLPGGEDPLEIEDIEVTVSEVCNLAAPDPVPFGALYYFEFRLVKAQNQVIQKVLSRTFTGVWSSTPSLDAAEHTGSFEVNETEDCASQEGAPVKLGGFVPGVELPSFGGAFPIVPSPTEP